LRCLISVERKKKKKSRFEQRMVKNQKKIAQHNIILCSHIALPDVSPKINGGKEQTRITTQKREGEKREGKISEEKSKHASQHKKREVGKWGGGGGRKNQQCITPFLL